MKIREKRRDKFFTRMCKWVKGLWKVLKTKDRLFYPRIEVDDDMPARWSEDDKPRYNDEDKKTNSDGST